MYMKNGEMMVGEAMWGSGGGLEACLNLLEMGAPRGRPSTTDG
jgi:hypothetical protein